MALPDYGGRTFKCAACRRYRYADEVLRFWPVADPTEVRSVCRPTLEQGAGDLRAAGDCFRAVVGSRDTHGIGAS